jgi:hypothetical protein
MAEVGAPLKALRGPWVGGYTSSVPPFFARPDQLVGEPTGQDTNSSRDCVIDPFTGGVSKRSGCLIQDDTETAGVTTTGLLNAKWGAKSRKIFALDSPSMDDGYPVPNPGQRRYERGFPHGRLRLPRHRLRFQQ